MVFKRIVLVKAFTAGINAHGVFRAETVVSETTVEAATSEDACHRCSETSGTHNLRTLPTSPEDTMYTLRVLLNGNSKF